MTAGKQLAKTGEETNTLRHTSAEPESRTRAYRHGDEVVSPDEEFTQGILSIDGTSRIREHVQMIV
jgi:hypothetical protein